jgi:hypothetical protein
MNGTAQDKNSTQSKRESTVNWKTRYELTVPGATVVEPNHLYAKFEALRKKSAIPCILHEYKQSLHEKRIKRFSYDNFGDLQSSYLGHCHLCALL